MIFKSQKDTQGFSLIEALVAILLLGIILISFTSVLIYGFNILSKTRQISLSTQIAQEVVESIRNKSFDELMTLGSTITHESLSLLEDGMGTLTVEEGPGEDIKKVTVRIRWNYSGNEMIKDVVTYMTREGINKK